jgi:hypothetical protein
MNGGLKQNPGYGGRRIQIKIPKDQVLERARRDLDDPKRRKCAEWVIKLAERTPEGGKIDLVNLQLYDADGNEIPKAEYMNELRELSRIMLDGKR